MLCVCMSQFEVLEPPTGRCAYFPQSSFTCSLWQSRLHGEVQSLLPTLRCTTWPDWSTVTRSAHSTQIKMSYSDLYLSTLILMNLYQIFIFIIFVFRYVGQGLASSALPQREGIYTYPAVATRSSLEPARGSDIVRRTRARRRVEGQQARQPSNIQSACLYLQRSHTHTHTDITTTLLHCYTVVVRLRVIHIIITVPLPVNSGSLTSFPLFSLQINMIQKIISLSCYWEIAK